MIITVDHKIRIPMRDLPIGAAKHIVDALEIPNVAREKQRKAGIHGWQSMPRTITMWEHFSDHITKREEILAPRGFANDLIMGLDAMGIKYEFLDRRINNLNSSKGNSIPLLPWQKPAVSAILSAQEGIWKAPAGSGKTVGVLEAIRLVSGPSLVIVNTKDILWQWMDRAKTFLGEGFPIGQIGDGVFKVSRYLTIATAQTLNSRFDQLERDGFFDLFTFMCLDECHHATANTYNKIVNRISARYRIGVSATPSKTGDFTLAKLVLGPVFHETKPADVTSLMRPEVVKITTKFEHNFHEGPNGYNDLLEALTNDKARNILVATTILREEGSHSLVISKRLEHLDAIERILNEMCYEENIFFLTGKENSEERKHVVEMASKEPCVIFSTLADEALDIPRLDRIFLTFPQRNTGLVTQQVGRVERKHPEKEDARIYDFADMNVGPCEAQWKKRRTEVYMARGYKITQMRAEDFE